MRNAISGILALASVMAVAGCSKDLKLGEVGVQAPTVVKSVEDLPKSSMSIDEIRKTGRIRVIAESAKGQTQYDALAASRVVAQKNALSIVQGTKVNSVGLIEKGDLKSEEIKYIVDGYIRTYDCGAFYDKALQVGYSCVEVPVR